MKHLADMTQIIELGRAMVQDPGYREGILARARAGTLPLEIEMLLLESCELAGRRLSGAANRPGPGQSRTLALAIPPVTTSEVKLHE